MSYRNAARKKTHGTGCRCGCGGSEPRSGRWERRGSTIVLLPDRGTVVTAPRRDEIQEEVGGGAPSFTVCDFIHPNIDVAAQYALFGMLRAGPGPRLAALQMLAAVRQNRLRGIYQEDQYVPAQRAKQLRMGWWDLIARNRNLERQLAACVMGDRLDPPLMVFRKSLASDHTRLGRELMLAWRFCGVPTFTLPTASGRSCTRPAPKPSPKPKLSADHKNPGFEVTEGDRRELSVSIRIRSSGPGTIAWRAETWHSWLRVEPESGSAPPEGAEIRLVVDPKEIRVQRPGMPLRIVTPVILYSPVNNENLETIEVTVEVKPRR